MVMHAPFPILFRFQFGTVSAATGCGTISRLTRNSTATGLQRDPKITGNSVLACCRKTDPFTGTIVMAGAWRSATTLAGTPWFPRSCMESRTTADVRGRQRTWCLAEHWSPGGMLDDALRSVNRLNRTTPARSGSHAPLTTCSSRLHRPGYGAASFVTLPTGRHRRQSRIPTAITCRRPRRSQLCRLYLSHRRYRAERPFRRHLQPTPAMRVTVVVLPRHRKICSTPGIFREQRY